MVASGPPCLELEPASCVETKGVNEDSMSTQPNRIPHVSAYIQFEKRPSARNTLLGSSTCTRKPCSARLARGHSPLTRSGQIGSAGTSTSRS